VRLHSPVASARGVAFVTSSLSYRDRCQFLRVSAFQFCRELCLVVLVFRMPSRCPAPLQSLYKKYGDVGLTVVALPCNDFGEQEPWEESRVQAFYKEVCPSRLPQ
jgi:glutathione peroxidase-family protein